MWDGVGVIITIIVFRSTKISEKNNKKVLDEIKEIVREEKTIRNENKKKLKQEINNLCNSIEMKLRLKNHDYYNEEKMMKEIINQYDDFLTVEQRQDIQSFITLIGNPFRGIEGTQPPVHPDSIRDLTNKICSKYG